MPSTIPIVTVRLTPPARRDLDRLVKALTRELGHPVSKAAAIAVAVTEAARRRDRPAGHGGTREHAAQHGQDGQG